MRRSDSLRNRNKIQKIKFVPKEADGDVNTPQVSQGVEFLYLAGGLLAGAALVYFLLGMFIEVIVPYIPEKINGKINVLYKNALTANKEVNINDAGLQKILDRLTVADGVPKKTYIVKVIESKIENAVAMPGGIIIYNSGLLEITRTEEEKAFVLAHEIGHFVNRDHLRRLGRGLVLTMAYVILSGSGNSGAGFITSSMSGTELRFSRKQELSADKYGVDLVKKVYGKTEGYETTLKIFENYEKNLPALLFFSTHPTSEQRIKAIEKYIDKN